MNFNLTAPDIQEALLFLPPVTKGREPVHEKGLRDVVAEVEWERQRERFYSTTIGIRHL